MHYFIEAILVGMYSSIFYILVKPFIENTLLLFFTIGFLKHFLGYFIGLHTYYCYKYNPLVHCVIHTTLLQLFMESIMEGLLFMALSNIIKGDRIESIFFIGVILHLVFEMMGLHKIFCKEKCKLK